MHISVRCSAAIHCLIFINEYGRDKKVTSANIAASSGVNPVTVRTILSALKKSGIITVKKGTGGARINADPKKVTLLNICLAVDPTFLDNLIGMHSPSPFCPVGKNMEKTLALSYGKIKDDLKESLLSVTLADVFKNFKNAEKTVDRA